MEHLQCTRTQQGFPGPQFRLQESLELPHSLTATLESSPGSSSKVAEVLSSFNRIRDVVQSVCLNKQAQQMREDPLFPIFTFKHDG